MVNAKLTRIGSRILNFNHWKTFHSIRCTHRVLLDIISFPCNFICISPNPKHKNIYTTVNWLATNTKSNYIIRNQKQRSRNRSKIMSSNIVLVNFISIRDVIKFRIPIPQSQWRSTSGTHRHTTRYPCWCLSFRPPGIPWLIIPPGGLDYSSQTPEQNAFEPKVGTDWSFSFLGLAILIAATI